MTPFAHRLRAARTALGISQGELSARVGYRQSYISAIECGVKLPKDEELVDRTIAALKLTEDQGQLLRRAFQQSQRYHFPPAGTPVFAYDVCARLSEVIPKLTPADIRALDEFISLLRRVQPISDVDGVSPSAATAYGRSR